MRAVVAKLRLALALPGALALLPACGGSPPPAPAEPPAPSAAPSAEASARPEGEEKPSQGLPTACADPGAKECLPPPAFVKRLCSDFYPNVALALFAKGTPWTRAYLSRNVEAWNASGGASSSDKLEFDEEVLVLLHRVPDTGGMTVSGSSGGYDVLRWDGTCASLMGEEITLKLPPRAKHAKIPWKSLDDKVREALQADEKVGKVVTERRKECKGATIGEVSLKCVKADTALSAVIVDFVREGGTLPPPKAP
jgi:hypothetical protein